MDLVPIKIKIGSLPNGYAKYPNFNQLQVVIDSGMDWSVYVDVEGTKWHYDKTCGHKEYSQDSPLGTQWGVLMIPAAFASQAIAMFPEDVSEITAVECADFYDNKAHDHEPDEILDSTVLEGIKAKQDLGLELTTTQLDALDPENDRKGIRRNKNKTCIEFLQNSNVNLVSLAK